MARKIISVAEDVITLQLEFPDKPETAGPTSLFLLAPGGEVAAPLASFHREQDVNALSSWGLSSEQSSSIIAALKGGQKIQAIKELREAYPALGLKEAKELVDRFEDALGIARKSQSGCWGSVVVLLVGLPFILLYLIQGGS